MKNTTALATGLAGIILGGVGGWLAGSSQPDLVQTDSLEPLLPNQGAAEAPIVPTELADVPAPSGEARDVVVQSQGLVEVSEAAVEAAARATTLEAADREEGDGEIWGQVTDDQGNPIAGVVLRGEPLFHKAKILNPDEFAADAPPLGDVREELDRQAREFLKKRANVREVTSDNDGQFRFQGLADNGWAVKAYKSGYLCKPRQSYAWSVYPGTELDFEASQVAQVPVEVVLADGTTATEATFLLAPVEGRIKTKTHMSWNPSNSSLPIAAGAWSVQALGEVYRSRTMTGNRYDSDLASETQVIRVPNSAGEQTYRFVLESRSSIFGQVVLEEDRLESPFVSVTLAPCVLGAEPDLNALATSENQSYLFGSLEFAFDDLEPGQYVIEASFGFRGRIVGHTLVEVGNGPIEADITVAPMDMDGGIFVRAEDAEGNPVSVERYRYNLTAPGKSSGSGSITALRLRDGRDYLDAPAGKEAMFTGLSEEDELKIQVTHEEFGSRSVQVAPGQREVSIVFDVPANLVVQLTGIPGGTVGSRLSVVAVSKKEVKTRFQRGKSADGNGEVQFPALEVGEYEIQLFLADAGDRAHFKRMEIASEDIVLRQGGNSLSLAVPQLYELLVFAPDAKVGAEIRVSARDADQTNRTLGQRKAVVGSDGRATFADLPAGTYSVMTGSTLITAEVPGGEVILEKKKKKKE